MRQAISLTLAVLLTLSGATALIFLLFFTSTWYRGWTIMAAGLVLGAGLVWLYSDLTDPPRQP
jgi:hypothetical protein